MINMKLRSVNDDQYTYEARLLRAGSRGGRGGGGPGGGGAGGKGAGAGIIGSDSGPFKTSNASTKVYDDTNFRESQLYTNYNSYFDLETGRTY